MKKLLLVLSLAFAVISFDASAATLSWVSKPKAGTTAGSTTAGLLGSYTKGLKNGSINDNWVFNIADVAMVNIILNVQEFVNSTLNLSVKLDGALISFDGAGLWSFNGLEGAGNHTISIVGTILNQGSTKSNININVGQSAVPVPGAIWLFGSALLGLVGLRSGKKQAPSVLAV
jgi:hypothetical protein